MAWENIRSNSPGFCSDGEYFYIMKNNMLIQKTSYGDPVATFPFNYEIAPAGGDFLSLQFDGVNFWSLEKQDSGTLGTEVARILRRWRIQNFVCALQDSWQIRGQAAENMNGKAFVIESYINLLNDDCGPGTSFTDRIKLKNPWASFFQVSDRFYLISATQGTIEEIQVATTPDSYTVTAASTIQNKFYKGDRVVVRRDLYYFNNQSPSQGAAGAALYWFSVPYITASDPTALNQLTYKGCDENGMYDGTLASTFLNTSDLPGINQGYYIGLIAYVRGQQLLLKRPNLPGSLGYPGPNSLGVVSTGFDYTGTNQEFKQNMASMIMDTAIKNDKITLHTIYDLAHSMDAATCLTTNIYRLQLDYTYGAGLEGSFDNGTYNYVTSVMKPMVTSIGLTAEPALVVANGVDNAFIWATVRDQYGAPLNYKRVVFGIQSTDSAAAGYFLCPETISECFQGSFTWLDGTPHQQAEIITGSQSAYPGGPPSVGGQAVIEWRAGTKAGLVTIVAIVQP